MRDVARGAVRGESVAGGILALDSTQVPLPRRSPQGGPPALRPHWLTRLGLGELPALRYPGFRQFWSGQSISLVGTTMHNAAVLWHVAQLAPSGQRAVALATIGLVRLLPLLGLTLLGGMAADRFDRRRVMLLSQSVLAVLAGALALLTLTGTVTLAWIYLLTGLKAAATAFDSPARSSLVPRLVPREHLPNAVSLNTSLFQITSLVGPAMAGVSLIAMDLGWLYAVNALSFLPVILALRRLRPLPQAAPEGTRSRGLVGMLDGLRYIFQNPLLRSSILLDFFVSFFGSATILLPLFASEILQVGPAGFGCLCAAPSIGAVTASLVLLRVEKRIHHRGRLLLWAAVGYGVANLLLGMTSTFAAALIFLAATGACDTVNMVLRNVIKQLATPDTLRGRMNGAQVLFAQGGPQLGELEAGLVAQALGTSASLMTGGLGCLLVTAGIAWLSPELRDRERAPTLVPCPQPLGSAA